MFSILHFVSFCLGTCLGVRTQLPGDRLQHSESLLRGSGSIPSPILRLFVRPTSNSPPLPVDEVKSSTRARPTGAYDRVVHRTFKISELSSNGATVFECQLELPGTNYVESKRIAYFPGLEGHIIETSHGLASSAHGHSSLVHIFCFLWLQFILLLHDT